MVSEFGGNRITVFSKPSILYSSGMGQWVAVELELFSSCLPLSNKAQEKVPVPPVIPLSLLSVLIFLFSGP